SSSDADLVVKAAEPSQRGRPPLLNDIRSSLKLSLRKSSRACSSPALVTATAFPPISRVTMALSFSEKVDQSINVQASDSIILPRLRRPAGGFRLVREQGSGAPRYVEVLS